MTLEQMQCYLTALGFYKLRHKDNTPAIDGIPGPATRQAIYNFQLQHSRRLDGSFLAADGIWGPATEKALREVIGSSEEPQKSRPAETVPVKGDRKWVNPGDFRCRCGGRYCNGWPAQPHPQTIDLLEQIGEHFHKPIQPHSGLRCQVWNRLQGGSPTSKHMYGMAMDFHLEGVPHQTVYDYADQLLGNSGGLGIYDWGIHIDDRPVKGRWDNRK